MAETIDTLIGILIGVISTVIGSITVVWVTEWLRERRNRRRLFKALYKEIIDNLERVNELLKLKKMKEPVYRYIIKKFEKERESESVISSDEKSTREVLIEELLRSEFTDYATLGDACYGNILSSGELVDLPLDFQRDLRASYDLVHTHNQKVYEKAEGLDEFYKSIQSGDSRQIRKKTEELEISFFKRLELLKPYLEKLEKYFKEKFKF